MARKLRIEYSGGVSRDSAWQPALCAFLGRHLWVFDWPANGLKLGFDMIFLGFSISRPLVARSFLIVAVALLIVPLSAHKGVGLT
jgi:hypothetical protein